MFRKFPRRLSLRAPLLLGILLFFGGCADPVSNLSMVYNPVKGIETGFWPMVLIAEMNTNFSSLLYDKTEAKFETFAVRPFQMLPDNSSYYVLPAIYVDRQGNKNYDDTYSRMLNSYIKFNNYGRVAQSLDDADYIIVVNVEESPEFKHGKNTSSIAVTIMDTDETPVFFANTTVSSKSDSNFYYRPSKLARPVKYLTLKGFERIFTEAMPQAFS